MNDYDLSSRRMVKSAPEAVLPWLLTDFDSHLRFLGWEDARGLPFPGSPEHINDMIAVLEEIQRAAPPWVLPLEFQTEPDPAMFGRLMVYLGSIWLEKRPDPLRGSRYQLAAAVINLTGSSAGSPASREYRLPGPDGLECSLTIRERYLAEESATALLDEVRTGMRSRWLLAFIPLMKIDDNVDVGQSWLELWNQEPDAKRRSEILAITRVFCELSSDRDKWHLNLEGLDVVKSHFLESIRAEGRTEGHAESLLETLETKFAGQVPSELMEIIRQNGDLAQLKQWFKAALNASNIAEFRQACGI